MDKLAAMHEIIDRMQDEHEIERAYQFLKKNHRKGSSRKWAVRPEANGKKLGKALRV